MMTIYDVSYWCRADIRPGGTLKPTDGEGCGRCGFAVYAAEQMLSRAKVTSLLISFLLDYDHTHPLSSTHLMLSVV